jgi:hypothetical protein
MSSRYRKGLLNSIRYVIMTAVVGQTPWCGGCGQAKSAMRQICFVNLALTSDVALRRKSFFEAITSFMYQK